MNIIVFGASGKVGRLVVDKLLHAGHQVSVFVHQSSPFDDNAVQIYNGSVHDLQFVGEAVRGHDAVISCLGSWHTPTKDILSAAMRGVIPAMQANNITRIITLTGSGALLPNEPQTMTGKIGHALFSFVARDIVRDGETHLQLLQDSGLDWTTLRAPVMRSGDGDYQLNNKLPAPYETVTRGAVAQAIIDQLTDTMFLREAPQVHLA